MWTRKNVKKKGKKSFLGNYWKCVLVALILTVAIGTAGASASTMGSSIGTVYNLIITDTSSTSDVGDDLDDLMDAPDPGPGPVFGMLVNKYPEAVKNNSALIEKLKQVNISTRHEAAMIVAAREKLRQEVTKEYFDPATDEIRKFILEASFGEYSYKVDENLCTLLYKQEATAAYIGWVLLSAPVDPVLAEYVDPEWGQKPQVMDEGMLLSEQEEFVFLRKYDRWEEVGEIKGLSDVRKRAEEIKQYLYAHPWQFDAQCITTISRGLV